MRLLGDEHIITGDEWVRMASRQLIEDAIEYQEVPLVRWSPIRSLLTEKPWRGKTLGEFMDGMRGFRGYEFVEFDSRAEWMASHHANDIALTQDGSDPGMRNVCYRSWDDWENHWLLFASAADRQAIRDGTFVECPRCGGTRHRVDNRWITCMDCHRRTPVDRYQEYDHTDGARRFRHDWDEYLALKSLLEVLDAAGARYDGMRMTLPEQDKDE